jgi:hypothetical protein
MDHELQPGRQEDIHCRCRDELAARKKRAADEPRIGIV